MKILSVVGARPEFIQAAPISFALQGKHQEVWVHTGQHYDYSLSQALIDDLGTPAPVYNLGVGSGSHASQTAAMLVGLEEVFLRERPDLVIVRGDTNSTLAGALAASKLGLPLAHVEAGERSYNRQMPEEINRLVVDRISDLHFCSSRSAVGRLAAEGISASVYLVGDVMLDALLHYLETACQKYRLLEQAGLVSKGYSLVTVHRVANTDHPERLAAIARALNRVNETVLFPVHPRTRAALNHLGISFGKHILMTGPLGYFDMLAAESNARLIATDSGGVQREAYILGVPCLTLREETEWTETVSTGWNRLVGVDEQEIMSSWHSFSPSSPRPSLFGDGHAAERIVEILEKLPAFSYQLSALRQPVIDGSTAA